MRELYDAMPDADAILALAPEELGAELLFLIRERLERDRSGRRMFHPGNLVGEVTSDWDQSRGQGGFPRERRGEIAEAVSEAFAWLQAQALIIPTTDNNAASGWKILSRRASQFETDSDYRAFVVARRLNRDLLHPTIAADVWGSMMRGDFPEAVFKAMRAVEIAVRRAGGYEARDIGTALMRKAFNPDGGPLSDSAAEKGERQALSDLFAGAIGSYKNPHSHRNVPMNDAEETIEIIMLANHLLRIVDARSAAIDT